jgi:dolichol-phosphate mannosyltransferase
MDSAVQFQPTVTSHVEARGVSLIVPTFNESRNLPELLSRIGAAFQGQADLRMEVLIADDESPDGTAQEALRLASGLWFPLRVISRSGPRSLARSVLGAAREARHAVLVVLDADLSHPPEEAPALGRAVLDGACDVAIGSRHVPGGEIRGWPLHRRWLSAAGTWLARFVQGPAGPVRDPLSGFFACRRKLLLEAQGPAPDGFKLLLHVLLGHSGLRALEHPIRFDERKRGTSKLGCLEGARFLMQLARCFTGRLAGRLLPSLTVFLKLHRQRRAIP